MQSSASTKKRAIGWAISMVALLAVWYFATLPGTQLGEILPGPHTIVVAFIRGFYVKIGRFTLIYHILYSLSRVFVAYSVAVVSGIVLGVAMGRNRLIEAIFRPFYEVIRPIPPIAWISLGILWFGLGELTKYFIIFLAAFSSITYTAFSGSRAVDPVLIGASRMLGAKGWQVFRTIVVPASVPYIFSGMQVAISAAWSAVVAAEMVRSSEGVGWIIVSGMENNDITQILVGIMAIGIMGTILGSTVIRKVESLLCAWRQGGS